MPNERLIYADDFLDLFYVASAGQDKAFISTVEMVVEDTPTIDAVEVVRCRDCEEYIPWLEGDYICGRIGSYFGNTKPNDFCSRGVRKADMEVNHDQT